MAILIVDTVEARARLRSLLTAVSSEPILEARTAEAALQILDRRRHSIRMLISELSLPGADGLAMLNTIRLNSRWADLTVFLLMSSDLSRRKMRGIAKSALPPDGQLSKPFKLTGLRRAIRRATARRNARRDELLYIGNLGPEFMRIQEALKSHNAHWTQLLLASTPTSKELIRALEENRVGALLIDPLVYATWPKDWLSRFKRTKLGTLTTVVCLSRAFSRESDLRLHAQLFLHEGTHESEWLKLLESISAKTLYAWELSELSEKARGLYRSKLYRDARRICRRILKIDPGNTETLLLLAKAERKLGRIDSAIHHVRVAVKLNPCSVGANLLWLDLTPTSRSTEQQTIAREALRYCPRHPVIRTRFREAEVPS